MNKSNTLSVPKWQQMVWVGAGLGLFLFIFALLWFVYTTLSGLTNVIAQSKSADANFIVSSTSLISFVVLRLLAILVGASIAFAGLAVSFFTHEKATSINHENNSGKFSLAAYSPGIVGVVAGTFIIISALYARSDYQYETESNNQTQNSAALKQRGNAGTQLKSLRDLGLPQPSCMGSSDCTDGRKDSEK